QALEEAKHFEALRRLVPAMTGEPFPAPNIWVRALYSYGVIDENDLPFMMGNINIVGEHLANQIFRKIKPVVKDEKTLKILNLIGKDESRHIAAGERFFPVECGGSLSRNATKIAAKNATTAVLLLLATYHLVGHMEALDIDLAQVTTAMYQHYDDVTGAHRGVSAAFLTALIKVLKRLTPAVIHAVGDVTNHEGEIDFARITGVAERLAASPRYLARFVA
ncbi:MAG TPA: ferritin-like domain-containing protein, partial [Planctomycetota bacterium]|nr:ferritin-like domain-containing protein [Planctomycetota bacterium]